MHGKERIEKHFMAKKAIGLCNGGTGNLRANTEEHFEAGEAVDAHAEIDDYEVGIGGEVYGAAVDSGCHRSSQNRNAVEGQKISRNAGKLDGNQAVNLNTFSMGSQRASGRA